MAEAIAFATPRTEEMTKVAVAGVGAGVTGAVQGVIIKMAPQMGTLEPVFTWGTLLGIPVLAAAAALFTRGLVGDLFMGAACGGLGVLGYSLPEMLAPITGRKTGGGGGGGGGVKQLGAGMQGAAQRMQQHAGARVGLEF